MELTRLEAAERQLRQAIRLFFGGGDEVSVHTLTGAACRVLRDLAKDAEKPAAKAPPLLVVTGFETAKE